MIRHEGRNGCCTRKRAGMDEHMHAMEGGRSRHLEGMSTSRELRFPSSCYRQGKAYCVHCRTY